MALLPFPTFRPDVDDYRAEHTQVLSNVVPRADGWGPMPDLQAYTQALPGHCRGLFFGRNLSDGTIAVFAGTVDRLFRLNNTDLTWVPVSKMTALTSISQADPGVFTLNGHGLEDGTKIRLGTTGTLPEPLDSDTDYYVVNADTNTFNVALEPDGDPIETTDAGSGTHSFTGSYSDLPSTDQWQFEQFGSVVIAVQANTAPQAYTIGSSDAFDDLAGSPPTSRYVKTVGRFLVFSGQVSNPRRVTWSGLDNITEYTPGTEFSGSYDAPDGGVVRGVAGGEFGLIFQESVIRRMVYVPGATPAFQIERVTEDEGLLSPYAIVRSGERIFYVSQQGFHQYVPRRGFAQIGKERVDRTFLADLDMSALHLLIGATDPFSTRVGWAYKSIRSSDDTAFDTIIFYDYALDRWSPRIAVSGQFITSLVKPGQTLEALDNIEDDIDEFPGSWDAIQVALVSRLAAASTAHELGFFDGANLEAVLETAEQSIDGRSTMVTGFYPRTDAATAYGSLRWRDTAQAALSQTSEVAINRHGFCPLSRDARLVRGRLRIPAGEAWTFCSGVEPQFQASGMR